MSTEVIPDDIPSNVPDIGCGGLAASTIVVFRSELVKKWGLAPSCWAKTTRNSDVARCLSPIFSQALRESDATFAERKATMAEGRAARPR